MRNQRKLRRVLAAFSVVAATGVGVQGATPAAVADAPLNANVDELHAFVAAQVPEYGGSYLDESTRTVYVHVTNGALHAAEASRKALADVAPTLGLDGWALRALPARFGFATLKGWFDEMTPRVLAIPGTVSSDIDEVANVLRVGVEDLAAQQRDVESAIAGLGIPRNAVVVEQREPVRYESRTLRRPILGGIQISFFSGGSEFLCTLGFPAVRGGVQGFVTNSHCTATQGGVQSTVHYQPTSAPVAGVVTTRVSQETVDPTYFTGGSCPAGRRCRRSDSSFSATDATTAVLQGHIARTATGSFTWNGVDTWQINGTATPPFVGLGITKQGRTTGRTNGSVTGTCITFNVAGTDLTQLCQSDGSYSSAGGDSGSGVFAPGANNTATLYGIHWGSGGIFSPYGAITSELGSLDVFA